jgi:hypothetical protein
MVGMVFAHMAVGGMTKRILGWAAVLDARLGHPQLELC